MVREYEILVIKKPRDDPIVDRPINFPPLENLHLDMMENKKKLKKNLPPLLVVKRRPNPVPVVEKIQKVENFATEPKAKPNALPTKAEKATVKIDPRKKPSDADTEVDEAEAEVDEEDAEAEAEEPPPPKASKVIKKVVKINPKTVTPAPPRKAPVEADDEDLDMLGELGADAAEDFIEIDGAPEEEPGEAFDADAGGGEGGGGGADENAGGDAEADTKPVEEDDIYAGLSPEEREIKEREEYIWRFRILKKQYKSRDIPSFNEHDDLPLMKTTYERTVREIHLENNVDTYRTYLVGGFMVTEFVCTQWMNVDLSGFTSQQMLIMDKYDRLLIELGERSYNRWGADFPVEIRLIGFILLQAGLFYIGKIIADKAGGSVAELFRGITGQPSSAAVKEVQEETPPPKKKMRGPSVKAEDIKKMAEDHKEKRQ